MTLLHDLGEMVGLGVPAAEVIERPPHELTHTLHLRRGDYKSGAPRSNRNDNPVERPGRARRPAWGVSTMGLPGPDLDLPVHHGGRTLGGFVMVPTPGWPASRERLIVAVAIAAHVGAALANVGTYCMTVCRTCRLTAGRSPDCLLVGSTGRRSLQLETTDQGSTLIPSLGRGAVANHARSWSAGMGRAKR